MIELQIHDIPPSMNKIGGHSSWRKWNWHKEKWQNLFIIALSQTGAPKPLPTPVLVTAVIRFPAKRRRDEGNFRMMPEKSLGDALVLGGYIPDDTPDFYRFQEVEFDSERGANRTTLYLRSPNEDTAMYVAEL